MLKQFWQGLAVGKAAAPPFVAVPLPPVNLMFSTQIEPNKQQLTQMETRGKGIIT